MPETQRDQEVIQERNGHFKKMTNLICRSMKYYRLYGLKSTIKRVINHREVEQEKAERAVAAQKRIEVEEQWEVLNKWIDETPHEFIDVFPQPAGWNTQLLQRFQHSLTQTGRLAFYGSNPSIDSDIEVFKIVSPTLCIVNLANPEISKGFWKILDRKDGIKIIRIQSVDLNTTINQMEEYIARGYQIIYEYMDELIPQTDGKIPEEIYKRHEYMLQNEEIIVMVTSDTLFNLVKLHRKRNMAIINRTDCDFRKIEKEESACPENIQQSQEGVFANTWLTITGEMADVVRKQYEAKRQLKAENRILNSHLSTEYKDDYLDQLLHQPKYQADEYKAIIDQPYCRDEKDGKIIAYYLTQFHPDAHNEKWWGKGVTEWNNVCRAVPQYKDHYQPRIPGELGYYDLRIKDNMKRQIELAQMYGIFGFSFYYYWFDGERLLEKPLEMFLNSPELDFPFCLCWANENWTKRYDGTSFDILMEQPKSFESYCNVIHDMIRFLKDQRYIEVDGKKLITVYRPSLMPKGKRVLEYWRRACRENGVGEIYVIAVKENEVETDWLKEGFDALSEFHPGTVYSYCENITEDFSFLRKDFGGMVFSYADIVENQKYFQYDYPKLYRSVMPMWDNTARRDHKGMIFDGSSPVLYKRWLKDVLCAGKKREDIEDNLIFINAWNEWGEGTYLEPDKRYGYAYLQATKEAIEESRAVE